MSTSRSGMIVDEVAGSPTYKTHYCVGNWRVYERALVSRGDVTLWVSAAARAASIVAARSAQLVAAIAGEHALGRAAAVSNCAIETALTLRLVFRLPLRQTEASSGRS